MKKALFALFLLLIAPAFAIEPHNTESMLANLELGRSITADFPITEASFTTYEFPVDAVSEPGGYEKEADEYGNTQIIIRGEDTLDMSYKLPFQVQTHAPSLLKSAPEFPTAYEGMEDYLSPGYYTPVTSGIRKKANEIVHGSETVFEAAARLALWTHGYVEYDASFGGRAETSSETFEKAKGTCDEFSHLFIAMARSVGIPARYVSGITYGTFGIESGGASDWYSHGWAEVYIGEWVPFDPTYGEIGYVDGTHIKIAHSPDQEGLESYITWRPDKAHVELGNQEHSIEVLEIKNFSNPMQKLSLELVPDAIGFGEPALVKIVAAPRGCNGQGTKLVFADKDSKTLDLSLEMGKNFMTTIGCDEPIEKYAILRSAPDLEKGFSYQYEILAYNNQHEVRKKLAVNSRGGEAPSVEISFNKLSFSPTEAIEIFATVETDEATTAYLFDDGGFLAKEGIGAGKSEISWVLRDREPGLHNIYLYVPRALAKASYSVEDSGPLSIEIAGQGTIEPGNRTWFEVKVDGQLYTDVTVTFDLFTTQTQIVRLTGSQAETLSFVVDVPQTEENKIFATAQVVGPGTSATAVKEILVYHKPVPKTEEAANSFMSILDQLIENFKYIFRQLLKSV